MSKYKVQWKDFDLNKDFWTEVLLGRKIEACNSEEKTVKVARDQNPVVFIKRLTLDSKEHVWISEKAVVPDDVIGKTITTIAWSDEGINALTLNDGSKIILPKQDWRICIQD